MFNDKDDDFFNASPKFSKKSLLSDNEIDKKFENHQNKLEPQREIKASRNPILIIQERVPHVANKIILMWGTEDLPKYMEEIVMMDRAGRAGFHSDVMNAIIEISSFIQRTSQETASASAWIKDPRLQKTFRQEEKERIIEDGSIDQIDKFRNIS